MIGIDMTQISRFKDSDDKFIKKVLHVEEIKEYNASKNKEYYLAGRWSIKEALFKIDNSLTNFNQIFIKKIDKKYNYKNYKISTSSEGDNYISFVQKGTDEN